MTIRFISIILIIPCAILISLPVYSDYLKLQEQEAKWIYESACQLIDEKEYDSAIRRLNWIILEFAETEYVRLAEDKRSEALNLKFSPKPISGASRASLVSFGTLFTIWTGFGIWLMTDSQTTEVAGIVIIASSLTGLAGSIILTKDMMLSDGQASLITFSGAWGIWQGAGAAMVTDAGEKPTIGASIAGGIVGLAASASIVRNRYITTGDATMINFGGIWGTWFAICAAMLADMEEGNDILTTSMIGGDVGFFTLALLAPKMKISTARARLINIGGIIGALYGLGTNMLFEIDSKSNFWSALGIGSILGLAAGTYFTRDYDIERDYFSTGYATNSFTMGRSMHPYTNCWEKPVRGIDIKVPVFNIKF